MIHLPPTLRDRSAERDRRFARMATALAGLRITNHVAGHPAAYVFPAHSFIGAGGFVKLDATGGNSFFTENIGRSRIKGIDVDLQYRATPTTLLRGSIQLLDNKLSSFVYNTQRNTTNNALPPIVGCPATAGTAQIPGSTTGATAPVWVVNCSGRHGFNSPKLSINGGLEQTFHAGTLDVVATVDGRYRSNRSTSFEFLPFQESGVRRHGRCFAADRSPRRFVVGHRLCAEFDQRAGSDGIAVRRDNGQRHRHQLCPAAHLWYATICWFLVRPGRFLGGTGPRRLDIDRFCCQLRR